MSSVMQGYALAECPRQCYEAVAADPSLPSPESFAFSTVLPQAIAACQRTALDCDTVCDAIGIPTEMERRVCTLGCEQGRVARQDPEACASRCYGAMQRSSDYPHDGSLDFEFLHPQCMEACLSEALPCSAPGAAGVGCAVGRSLLLQAP